MDSFTDIAIKGHVFWIVFALTGALFILRTPYSEVLLGFVVIILGIHKLSADLEAKKERDEKLTLAETLREIREWMEQERAHIKRMEVRYENRFFQDNKKRIDAGKKMDKLSNDSSKLLKRNRKEVEGLFEKQTKAIEKYVEKTQRGLVRKVLDMDNKIADMTRIFLKKHPRSGRG